MVQSVSKTYQAHTSTNGSLFNGQCRQGVFYTGFNGLVLQKFREIGSTDAS